MALLEEQFTETLQAGAPDITYEGGEGREQQVAQALWDRLPPQARMQFGSFQQFFSSGAWKQVLQMLQQQMQGQQGPQEEIQETQTETIGAAPQAGLGALMPQAQPMGMAYGGTPGADGRRQYGIGSWFQEKIMDPIKKVVKSPVGKLAGAAALGYGLNRFGLPFTKGFGTEAGGAGSGWWDTAKGAVTGSDIWKGGGDGGGLQGLLTNPNFLIPALLRYTQRLLWLY